MSRFYYIDKSLAQQFRLYMKENDKVMKTNTVCIKTILHSCLLAMVKLQRRYNVHILNEQPKTENNVIYAVNHSCKDDFPLTCEAVGKHTYVLVGKQPLRLIDRICFRLNGVIYVDRKDKSSRKKASGIIRKHLLKGHNVCIYPEGTWNLTPSKPMLPLYWGIIDVARETSVPIVPLVLEYKGSDCYAKWGGIIRIASEDNKQDKINELSDGMATLKRDIWELFPMVTRENINEDEWKREVEKRLTEYAYLDYEYEKSCVLESRIFTCEK